MEFPSDARVHRPRRVRVVNSSFFGDFRNRNILHRLHAGCVQGRVVWSVAGVIQRAFSHLETPCFVPLMDLLLVLNAVMERFRAISAKVREGLLPGSNDFFWLMHINIYKISSQ